MFSSESEYWDSDVSSCDSEGLFPYMDKHKLEQHVEACHLEELNLEKERYEAQLTDIKQAIVSAQVDKDLLHEMLKLSCTNYDKITDGGYIFASLVRPYYQVIKDLENMLQTV